ncbi:preprotein translocase subunit SecE [Tessaracoccus lapidicaptus]|uniref:preprotein translocase subunit SecE n=1 Tax=Tessaracoccus lapidicaptus TaxID=1427523 RepID=UPI003340D328
MSDKSRDAEPADAVASDEAVDRPSVPDESVDAEFDTTQTEPDPVEAGAVAPITRRTAKAPVRKDAPTRRRSAALAEDEDHYRAHNPAEFVRQSAGELKKVVWPTWPQLVVMFGAVLVFVLIMILIVGLLDLGFGWALLQLFGSNA